MAKHEIIIILGIVFSVCFSAYAVEPIDPTLEKQLRKSFEWQMREAERKTGKKVTEDELEQAWPKYLEAKKKQIEKKATVVSIENRNLPIKGRVVDQYGEPVPSAKLELYSLGYSVRFFRRRANYKEAFPVTNNKGEFTVGNLHGEYIGLNGIVPPAGYKYLPEHQVAKTFYPDTSITQGEDVKYYDPTPKNPVGRFFYDSTKHVITFKLWKQVYETQERLLQGDFRGKVNVGGGWHKVNIFRLEGNEDFSKVTDPNGDIDGDILFKVDFSEDKKNIILTVAPVDGGIIENPDNSLNAPGAGYAQTIAYEFAATDRSDFNDLLFTKSRGDRIFTRIRLSVGKQVGNDEIVDRLVISGKFFANPQGSRNLEPWGPRHGNTRQLAKRNWKQKGFDDFKDRLKEDQAVQMAQLESMYLCQIEDSGEYFKGFLGANQTFYKYIGTGNNQMYDSIPIVAKPRNMNEIEPQNTFTYISGLAKKGYGRSAGFVFEQKKLLLHFSEARFSELKKRSNYLPLPNLNFPKPKYDKYEVIEIEKPVPVNSSYRHG